LEKCGFDFFVGTKQAADWYDPPKLHTIAEYQWVLENVEYENAQIIDAGAHHGHYSLLFACADRHPRRIHSVEPLPGNCAIIKVNAALNNVELNIIQKAISSHIGIFSFVPRGNGKLFPGAGIEVQTLELPSVNDEATIVKLDIEGMEFQLFPTQLDSMPKAQTWIIEIHPNYGEPEILIKHFLERNFRSYYLDKNKNVVTRYQSNNKLTYSTSLFLFK
jgi:FkbM family methyltransferase